MCGEIHENLIIGVYKCIKLFFIILQDNAEDIHVFERAVGITRQELSTNSWSIIIPTLNEENNILACLENITKVVDSQIIVLFGQSI